MLTMLTVPTIDGQDDEADDGPAPVPFVAHFLEIAPLAIDAFHVIVGADLLACRTVQVDDHFVELVGCHYVQGLGQVGIGKERRVLDEGGTPTTGIVHLHDNVLGRDDALDSAEVSRTFDLFAGILADAKLQKGIEKQEIYHCRTGVPDAPADPQYTIRAWRGVLTYLLRRSEFLYE